MQQDEIAKFVDQAVALSMNFIKTCRFDKMNDFVRHAKQVSPDHEMLIGNFRYDENFVGEWWTGESLENKSIEIFCDEGMGDTINCLRYIESIKKKWNCKVVLNCHAWYKEFKRLMEKIPYVDEFVQFHTKCDYCANVLTLPLILHGVHLDFFYTAHWHNFLELDVPPMPKIVGTPPNYFVGESSFRIGIAQKSNRENIKLYNKKTVPIIHFAQFEDGINELYSIIPNSEKYNFMVQPVLTDLLDTVNLMSALNVVITVDTVTLHLAGSMGIKTLALLPFDCDSRWGTQNTTVWYPSVEIYRQKDPSDWSHPISEIKDRIVSLRQIC